MRPDYHDCDAEIIKDHTALTYTLKPRDLQEAAEMACKLKVSDMNTVFPDVSQSPCNLLLLLRCELRSCLAMHYSDMALVLRNLNRTAQ